MLLLDDLDVMGELALRPDSDGIPFVHVHCTKCTAAV